MSLLSPATHCIVCGALNIGRRDKVFCTVTCKSLYHYRRKLEHTPVTYPLDSMLHRNWVVLQEAFELAGKAKFFVSPAHLQKAGFRPEYFTSSATNKHGKTYYYIYNFGWMQFTEKELMVIRLNKPR